MHLKMHFLKQVNLKANEMSKNYQTFSRIFIIILLIFVGIKSLYEFKKSDVEHVVVAGEGIVTSKFENDYTCGSKGKYTCYSRYLILDNSKKVEVNFDTFTSMQIGDSAYLTYKKKPELTVWSFIGFVIVMISSLLCILFILMFAFWSAFRSSKISFIIWFKKIVF